jgi:hypothetical protein
MGDKSQQCGKAARDGWMMETWNPLNLWPDWEVGNSSRGTLQIDLQRRNKILGKIELVGWCDG